MGLSDVELSLLRQMLQHLNTHKAFPRVADFERQNEEHKAVIEELAELGYLCTQEKHYLLTWKGLWAADAEAAQQQVAACDVLLKFLRQTKPSTSAKPPQLAEIAKAAGVDIRDAARSLTFLDEYLPGFNPEFDPKTGMIASLLDVDFDALTDDWPPRAIQELGEGAGPWLRRLDIQGYRPFRTFSASFRGLTVIIGANASGKSSLFDFIRFLAFAAQNPLPVEIDPGSAGRTLFHAGGPEQIKYELDVDLDLRRPLTYAVTIQGPVGQPKITNEELCSRSEDFGWRQPFQYIRRDKSANFIFNRKERFKPRPWDGPANELYLRRILDPSFVTAARFRSYVAAWRVYSGFDVSATSATRRPAIVQPDAVLTHDGGNVSAVLFSLMTEHQESWQELETHLRVAIPGFQALTVKARGGPGTVMALFREAGVSHELPLADLSDGSLRFLCWATLCLAPNPPPLICIDEPELGLHPRALPVLAGLIRQASAKCQILCATQSPYLLSQFSLDQIAVMRKEDGQPIFVRPASSAALREEIDELGDQALLQLYLSGELEARS